MTKIGVVLFHTTSSAIRSEKVLVKEGLSVKLIPTPREFSSDCGIALRFEWEQACRIQILLRDAEIEIAGLHPL